MPSQDRRSGEERRSTNRYPVEMDVEWEGSAGRAPGSISDVSDGERVKLFIPLADGMNVEFGGHVANHVIEIGFGFKFAPLSDAQRDMLMKIVWDAKQT